MQDAPPKPKSLRELFSWIRKWAKTPTPDNQPEKLEFSLYKSGTTVHQVDASTKATFKGELTID